VFQDRLAEVEGYYDHQTRFRVILNDAMEQHFQMNYKEHVATMKGTEEDPTYVDPIFVDFLGYEDLRVYEEVQDMQKLKENLEESLIACNNAPRAVKLDMVLFEQAIVMTTKVHRIFATERGHLVLAGLPSVGRKTVCRLGAFVEEMNTTRLEITKNFGLTQFRQKMKSVWELAAYNGREKLKTVFLLEEQDIV
jgi:dynein heavy chain